MTAPKNGREKKKEKLGDKCNILKFNLVSFLNFEEK